MKNLEVTFYECQMFKNETFELKKEMNTKIDELIQRQHKHEEEFEKMKKLNCKLLDEFRKYFSNLEQMIQSQHHQSFKNFLN